MARKLAVGGMLLVALACASTAAAAELPGTALAANGFKVCAWDE
jgi:hypothetical protein